LVISFDEVVSVEKKSTAVVFPNAIVIQTLHARNVFASFLTRDTTYDLIIGIWKISHPNLKSSLNGVTLDGEAGTGDKTEKAESVGSEDRSVQDSDDKSMMRMPRKMRVLEVSPKQEKEVWPVVSTVLQLLRQPGKQLPLLHKQSAEGHRN